MQLPKGGLSDRSSPFSATASASSVGHNASLLMHIVLVQTFKNLQGERPRPRAPWFGAYRNLRAFHGLLPFQPGIVAEDSVDLETLGVRLEVLPLDLHLGGDHIGSSDWGQLALRFHFQLTEVRHGKVHYNYVDNLVGADVGHRRLDEVPACQHCLKERTTLTLGRASRARGCDGCRHHGQGTRP